MTVGAPWRGAGLLLLVRAALLAVALACGVTGSLMQPAPRAGALAESWVVTWDDVERWIWSDAAAYGVSGAWLLAVARCETGYTGNVYAVGRLGEVGPFQWHPRGLWWATPAGRAGESPWNIRRNVEMAAWAFARGYWFHWSCAR